MFDISILEVRNGFFKELTYKLRATRRNSMFLERMAFQIKGAAFAKA